MSDTRSHPHVRRAALLGVCVVVALAWVLMRQGRESVTPEVAPKSGATVVAVPDALPGGPPPVDLQAAPSRAVADALPVAQPRRTRVARVTYLGDAESRPSGTIVVSNREGPTAVPGRELAVENGDVSAETALGDMLTIDRLVLDGVEFPADVLAAAVVSTPADGTTLIQVPRPSFPRIDVLDAETMTHIENALALVSTSPDTLFDKLEFTPSARDSAKSQRILASRGRIDFPATWKSIHVYVGAPWHEWKEVSINVAETEALKIVLRHAGSAELTLGPARPRGPVFLELTHEDRDDWRTLTLTGGEAVTLDGLLSGRWTARSTEYSVATAFEVVAGKTTAVGIELTLPLQTGNLTVEIAVPCAWKTDEVVVDLYCQALGSDFHRSAKLTVACDKATPLRFDSLQPGEYDVVARPFHWRERTQVVSGETRLQFLVPEPLVVYITVVDESRGRDPIANAEIEGWVLDSDTPSKSAFDFKWDSVAKAYSGLVPRGVFTYVDVEASGYEAIQVDLPEVVTAKSDVRKEVSLLRSGTLDVQVNIEGKGIGGVEIQMWDVEAKRDWTSMSTSDSGLCRFSTLRAGQWRVGVVAPSGYAKPDGQAVEIVRGETRRVVLELKRAR